MCFVYQTMCSFAIKHTCDSTAGSRKIPFIKPGRSNYRFLKISVNITKSNKKCPTIIVPARASIIDANQFIKCVW